MNRFFLSPEQCQSDSLTLAGGQAHHALHVLRLRLDDQVLVLDGAGHELLAAVRQLGRDTLTLEVLSRRARAPAPFQISLLQAFPKGRLLEDIIQKATELGVHRIVPLLTERAVPHLDLHHCEAKLDKWRQTALEAVKQCGQAWLPTVEAPVSFRDYLRRGERFDLSLIAALQPGTLHPRECFRQFRAEHHRSPRTIALWIGPEGDFTPAEVAGALALGASPITLGPLVLRVETAAIAGLAILNYETQDRQGDPAAGPGG